MCSHFLYLWENSLYKRFWYGKLPSSSPGFELTTGQQTDG